MTNIILSKQEVSSIILILHTADYAVTRLPSLTDSCKRAVEDEYAQYVSFTAAAGEGGESAHKGHI